jgi:hypothetical protein
VEPHQGGFALIAVLALAAMIAAFLIAIGINRSQAELANTREDRSMSALKQAKAALIAYAASEQWQAYKGQTTNQPGGLPCPDTGPDNTPANTGVSSGICPSAASRVGRLPFATIGSDDLKDASGERLWYAVSSNFYKNIALNVINSDTPGLLIVQGSAPASNVVAIVFAPGPAIRDTTTGLLQDRRGANYNRTASYLEKYTAVGNDYTFWSDTGQSDTFNDRLLVITQADLMAAVEPVVAARIQRDVVPQMNAYFAGWNAYPFATPFNPNLAPQNQYQGQLGAARGLLPMAADPTTDPTNTTGKPYWDTASITLTEISGGTGAGASVPPSIWTTAPDCTSASTRAQINCTVWYTQAGGVGINDRPNIKLQATLKGAGLSFAMPFSIYDVMMTGSNGNTLVSSGPGKAYFSDQNVSPFPSVTQNLNAATGDATVTVIGILQNNVEPPPISDGTGGVATITITLKTATFTNPNDPNVGWFAANQWYRQTYYAVSPGFVPGAGAGCVALPTPPPVPPFLPPTNYCFQVNNPQPTTTTPYNNKQAVVIFAGRSLSNALRPNSNLPDYLEPANYNTAINPNAFIFENRSGSPTSINDRVVVVSP